MSATTTPPALVSDPTQMVHDLVLGRWILVRHEWIADDREWWVAGMVDAAAGLGAIVEFVDIPNRNILLGVNVWSQPTLEQVVESVERLPRPPAGAPLVVRAPVRIRGSLYVPANPGK